MIRLCAWCGKKLDGKGQPVSHGICPRCYGALFQCQFAFYEQLPAPDVPKQPTRRRAIQARINSTGITTVQERFAF